MNRMRSKLVAGSIHFSPLESLGRTGQGLGCMDSTEIGTRPSHRNPIRCNAAYVRAVLQLGLMAGLALLIGISAAGQEAITLPLDSNGEPVLPPGAVTATAYVIDAFAGTGEQGFHGDGGPATQARFQSPGGIAVDAAGNVYVADVNNGRVRRIDQAGKITTIAGTGERDSAGDGGPAVEAQLLGPNALALDASGNLYIAETPGHRVRKIEAMGRISTVAGTGVAGSEGDGGPAVEAQLNWPAALAVDAAGNLLIGESRGHRVRKVSLEGTISTIAGTGSKGSAGDGGAATAAQLNFVSDLATDALGNIYLSDINEGRIRKISPTGRITTVAGTGVRRHAGDGGPATEAQLDTPGGIALDPAGNLFLSEYWSGWLRKINAAGIIQTIAGTGEQLSTGNMGLAIDAALDRPGYIAVDSDGNLYVGEFFGNRIRILRPTAKLSRFRLPLGTSGDSVVLTVTEAGSVRWNGTALVHGLEAVAANGNRYAFGQTAGGAVTATYVPDRQTVQLQEGKTVTLTGGEDGAWRIGDQVATNGHRHVEDGREYLLEWTGEQWRLARYTIRTIAGTVDVAEGVPASEARLFNPYFVAFDSTGNAYVSEASNNRVRKIDASGIITTIAGTGEEGYAGDGGPATQAEFDSPRGIGVNWLGEVFVADYGNNVVRKIDVTGRILTIRTTRRLYRPHGLALDLFGNVIVAESHVRNHLVRRIDIRGNVTTVAGVPGQRGGFEGGGSATAARLYYPRAVASDAMGNVYVADSFNNRVRKIDPTGMIVTIAGTGERGYTGDGGSALDAQLSGPNGVLVDSAGNVFISDAGNFRLRKVDPSGMIDTIAGTGEAGDVGNGGPAVKARLRYPRGLAIDSSDNLFLADSGNDTVRQISEAGTIMPFAGTGEPFDKRDGGPASMAQFGFPVDIVADAIGSVYVLDQNQVRRIDTEGMIAAIAGTGDFGHSGDGGPAIAAQLEGPSVLELDTNGNLYMANIRRVRKIDAEGTITTIAGTGERGFSGDGGPATAAQLDGARSIAVDSIGNVYIADYYNHRVRKIDVSGVIMTFAGTGVRDRSSEYGYVYSTGDSQSDYFWEPGGIAPASQARLVFPFGLAVDASDNLYVYDWGNRSSANGRVGRIGTTSSTPLIEPLAPLEVPRFPTSFDVDDSGNVFVFYRGSVLMFGRDGSGTTVAGGGETRFTGSGEPAGGVFLGRSARISLDQHRNIWVADSASRRVHVLEPVP